MNPPKSAFRNVHLRDFNPKSSVGAFKFYESEILAKAIRGEIIPESFITGRFNHRWRRR